MLRLLRRVDSFLGADSMDKVSVLNALFDEIVSVSQDNINYLNRIPGTDLDKLKTRDNVLTVNKLMINEHIARVKSLEFKISSLEFKYKIQFLDALFCYVYHQVDEMVRKLMSGDNFLKDLCYLKYIELRNLYDTPCMQTKQSVLEYAVCEDTNAYWRNFTCLSTWFDFIAPTSCKAIMDLNDLFSQHRNDKDIDELMTEQAIAIQQAHLNRVEIFYTRPNTTSKNHREQFFDALLCHIYHQIILDVRSIIIRHNIFSVSLLKTTRAMSLLGTPCMKTRAEVLDYAVCCDTKAYWENFDRNRL